MVNAPRLRPKKLSKRDKQRAADLMADRVTALALEEGLSLPTKKATNIVNNEDTRRSAGYSTYGHWLIKRMEGITDGKSILALWRVIAWHSAGSPRKDFTLGYKDFIESEEALLDAIQSELL